MHPNSICGLTAKNVRQDLTSEALVQCCAREAVRG
jgi:hypothetical protein